MKTILVTGGAGFIGSNLCKKLLEQGNHVIAIDNFITSSGENLQSLHTHPNFTFVNHDITKPFSIRQLADQISNLQAIYDLACPTGVPNLTKLAEEMLLTCSVGTQHMLELARQHNATFLFTSSSEVYGNPEKFPQDETYTGNVDPIGIRSPYEEGKRFGESLVTMYMRKYGLDAKIVRIFNTYGPRMTLADTRVIPKFIMQLQANKPLTVEGDGMQSRTFCYVADLVQGLQTVMEKGTSGEVYNLGNDQQITMKELAAMLYVIARRDDEAIPKRSAKITPHGIATPFDKLRVRNDIIKFIPRPSHDHQSRMPSLKKVKKLGWQPTTNLEEGLKKTLRFYGVSVD